MVETPQTTASKLERRLSNLQSILISLAVIIGGAWALWNFVALGQKARADAELQELQRKLVGEPSIKTTFDISQLSRRNQSSRTMVVRVSVANTGTRGIVLDLRGHPLRITRLVMATAEVPRVERTFKLDSFIEADDHRGLTPTRILHLRGKSVDTLPYIVVLDKPGIYVATFAPSAGREEVREFAEDAIRSGIKGMESREAFDRTLKERAQRGYYNKDEVTWSTTTLFEVQ